MSDDKKTGSYYTPTELIDFMVTYLRKEEQDFSNILEPSAGDGRFFSSLLPLCGAAKAIERFAHKVQEIRERYGDRKLEVIEDDFIHFSMTCKDKYSLIIGNPPYINPKTMDKDDLERAKQLCMMEGLKPSVMQNMWLAFVLGACRVLEKNGTIFFVLPMEFLQVQYAEKLREHLEKRFNTIHIITFEVPVFPDIEQEICLVYLTNRRTVPPYILYEKYKDARACKPVYQNMIKKNKPLKKWSNAILSDDDIMLLQDTAKCYSAINAMGISAPGIVTGGNKYFIITEQEKEKYDCEGQVLEILQKSAYVSENTIMIDERVVNKLREENKPMYLLNLAGTSESDLSRRLSAYLEWAGNQKTGDRKLKERYKCANRTPWYGVPIVNKGDVIFFKRYHMIPRVYSNRADIHTTDAGYHIRLDQGWDKDSLVFCFYNSLTLAQCEFEGRYYGGGVSELVPSEFKKLRIPYRHIEKQDMEALDQMFREKKPVEEIVSFVNARTLAGEVDGRTIQRLEEIRIKLLQRRYPDSLAASPSEESR